MQNTDNQAVRPVSFLFKIRQYLMLLKFRLSALVVFSGAFGYLLANKNAVDWQQFTLFCLGSFMITGAANIMNQIIEKDLDKLMRRTANRPLPTGNLSVLEATYFAIFLAMVGSFFVAYFVNLLTVGLCIASMLLYAFAYTPLKTKTPFAVLVGAFPGALPPLIGYVAMSGRLSIEAFVIFGIQFVWQFPHFWAVAWIGDDDYRQAGMRLLPSAQGRDLQTALQMMLYTLFLIPLGMLPAVFGMTGQTSAIVAAICGVLFLLPTLYLIKEKSRKAALWVMFSSFFYLPIIQIAYLMDKI